jgi:predicted metal-dependent hydrolase
MSIIIDNLIHSRRKTVALIIQADGKLTVRAPMRMSGIEVRKFVQNHEAWIRKNQDRLKSSPPPPEKGFQEGELLMFMGQEYPLTIVKHQRPSLILTDTKFQLSFSKLLSARQEFTNWYKTQARTVISKRVDFYANQLKFKYTKIRISSARTRWGSCSSKGTLSFSWRLVIAPPEIVDYVVLHELVHTQVKNHSKKFWLRLSEILPEYKMRVCWLKENGKYLTLNVNAR